ncbi:MAG: ABATE domain-containing protein [Chloroflexota bacterium]|nr:ABATE domain-containing protein [Chloroflexota bacterium]
MVTAHQKHAPAGSDTKQICVDFANTLAWRASDRPQDRLTGPDMLLRFGGRAGIFHEGEVDYLRARVADDPEEAQVALEKAKLAREAIYRILFAAANRLPIAHTDVTLLNEVVDEAQDQVQIVPAGPGESFVWRWKSQEPQLDMVLWSAARSAAELLTSEELKRLKSCPGAGCAYLFIDLSRNGKRRWCEMDVCGNRNKVKRFRQSRQMP